MGLPSPKSIDPLASVPRNYNSEPGVLQRPLDHERAFFIVVNNQNAKLRLAGC
jgi:hypothetical protein